MEHQRRRSLVKFLCRSQLETIVEKVAQKVLRKLETARNSDQGADGAAAAVQGLVGAVLTTLTGELGDKGPEPESIFKRADMPIDLGVPDKIKVKIMSSQYVDFGSLIVNYFKSNNSYRINISDSCNIAILLVQLH